MGAGRRFTGCSGSGNAPGVWAFIVKMLQAFADAAGAIVWDVSVDSAIAQAHQHGAGARRDGDLQAEHPGGIEDEPADHGLGRSRGGWTTKTHLACEQARKALSIVITAVDVTIASESG